MGLWTSVEFRGGKTAHDGGSNPPGTIILLTRFRQLWFHYCFFRRFALLDKLMAYDTAIAYR